MALEQAGRSADGALTLPAFSNVQSGEAATLSAIEQGLKFDAVFAVSDLIAIGAMRALSLSGVSVPEDIAVVGYDNIPAARLINPRLTTIDQDTNLAGRMLVSKLIDTHGGQAKSERLETSLLIRDSCGG